MPQPRVPIGFDWVEYLHLAKNLSADTSMSASEEAKLRSSISRAYYAAYHKASRVAFPDRQGPRGFGSHAEVQDFFFSSDDPSRRNLGAELQRLHGCRKKADYHSAIPGNLAHLAADTITAAEELIANLDAL